MTDGARRRGADLARTALTLQAACQGGFILGIGAGEAVSTVPFGYGFHRPVGSLETVLQDMRSLIDTGAMPSGVGRNGLGGGGPRSRPKIWVAANAPRSLRLAGRYGDGWLPTASGPAAYAEQYAVVREAATMAGRATPTTGLSVLVLFGASEAAVASELEAHPLLKLILLLAPSALWARYGLEHPAGPNAKGYFDVIPHELDPDVLRRVAPTIPIEMVNEFVLTGNAQDVAAKVRPYEAAGAQQLIVGDLTGLLYPPATAMALMSELAGLNAILRDPASSA